MTFGKTAALALVIGCLAAPGMAGNGNGNGNGGGNGNANGHEKSGNRGQGSVRSELKGGNASNASETALANASANSRVAAAAVYRDAVLSSEGLVEAANAAQQTVDDYVADSYPGYTSAEIAAQMELIEDTESEDYLLLQGQYDTAVAYETQLGVLQGDATTAAGFAAGSEGAISEALINLVGTDDLSDAALDELNGNLGL